MRNVASTISPPLLTSATMRSAWCAVSGDRHPRPFGRRIAAGGIGQHIAVPVAHLCRRRRCRSRRNPRPTARPDRSPRRRGRVPGALRCAAASIEAALPQRAGHVVEQLGVEFLPAEPGALVAHDLVEERPAPGWRGCRRSAARHRRRSGRRASSRIRLIGRGVVVTTARGSSPSAQPEHQHVPGFRDSATPPARRTRRNRAAGRAAVPARRR